MARALAFRALLISIFGAWLLVAWQLLMTAMAGAGSNTITYVHLAAFYGAAASIILFPIPLAALFLFFMSAIAFRMDSAGQLVIREDSWFARLLRWRNRKEWEKPQTGCSIFRLTIFLFFKLEALLVVAAIVSAGVWAAWHTTVTESEKAWEVGVIALIGASAILGLFVAVGFTVWFVRRPVFQAFWQAFKDNTCVIVRKE
ncbi:MAG: hypothetical protein HYS44_01820 [Candidatus Niyogibacteria bacterium]|nr:hypothetical protein [Candidatus Niyogibacteria bacterium]